MESTHREYVETLRLRHKLGQSKESQEILNWWHQFRILIEKEEDKELREGKKPAVRMRYMKRLVKKYATNLNNSGQEISAKTLWESFVKDAGGEDYGYFIIQHWQGSIKLAIESIIGEPMPMEHIGYPETYRDEL